MGGFVVQIPSGAVAFYTSYHTLDYLMKYESKERQDDFNKFLYSVKEACIRKTARFIVDNEMDAEGFSLDDQLRLQTYDFDLHVRSSKLIEFDSCLGQLLKDNVLDLKSFPVFDQDKFVELFEIFPELPQNLLIYTTEMYNAEWQQKLVESLKNHINELKDLESIDEMYAYRKSLAKCEFIKCESDFDEIFNRLKEKWSNASDDVLKIALRQHFSLLRGLKNDPETSNDTILNKPTDVNLLLTRDIQEVIDYKHHAQQYKLLEKRLERYHQHMEFRRLIALDVTEFDSFGIKYVPKSILGKICVEHKLKNLFEIKDAVKPASGVESSKITKGLPLPHQLNHVRAKFMGGSKKVLPTLVNAVLRMGVGISEKVRKLWL